MGGGKQSHPSTRGLESHSQTQTGQGAGSLAAMYGSFQAVGPATIKVGMGGSVLPGPVCLSRLKSNSEFGIWWDSGLSTQGWSPGVEGRLVGGEEPEQARLGSVMCS